MREILFRAKRLDNGEWVEGIPIQNHIGTFICFDENPHYCHQYGYMEIDEVICVVPEIVCQYTGLTDRNGKKIFEGDILYGEFYGYPFPCNETFKIYWDEGEKGFKANYFNESNCEVIGNIFDNPELLKEGAK